MVGNERVVTFYQTEAQDARAKWELSAPIREELGRSPQKARAGTIADAGPH